MKLQSLSLLFAFRTIRCCLPGFQRRLLPGCFGLYVIRNLMQPRCVSFFFRAFYLLLGMGYDFL